MKRILLLLFITCISCDEGIVSIQSQNEEISSAAFTDLLLSTDWQIKEGFISSTKVIENGKSISPLVDFVVDEQITWIRFNKDASVQMYFDAAKQTLSMQYEVGKEAKSMRITPGRGIQDFLQRENWELSDINVSDQTFKMKFTETISGVPVVTELVLTGI